MDISGYLGVMPPNIRLLGGYAAKHPVIGWVLFWVLFAKNEGPFWGPIWEIPKVLMNDICKLRGATTTPKSRNGRRSGH